MRTVENSKRLHSLQHASINKEPVTWQQESRWGVGVGVGGLGQDGEWRDGVWKVRLVSARVATRVDAGR